MRPVISFQDFYNSIWNKIPEVWRSADSQNGKPLEILTITLAQQLYYTFYLKIAAMDELFDVEKCPDKYLPFLASTVNWTLIGTDSNSWRQQIKAAPLLYKIKGTKRSIVLAEKLIGYSVFISELWRDSTGQITPKEKLWNNFPTSVRVKPWFRQTSPDIKSSLLNTSFSDLLPAYNSDTAYIGDNGDLIPFTTYDTGTNSILDTFVPEASSTPEYNPITGTGSNSRLSKVSRINAVLKKDLDLDFNTNGIFTDTSLPEAIELLLQFKPFHVYIDNLLVMYDLSDYVFGYTGDITGGDGSLPGDAILSRESADITVSVLESGPDAITYYGDTTITPSIEDPTVSFDDVSPLKGKIKIATESFTLAGKQTETDIAYLSSLGFTLSGYCTKNQIDLEAISRGVDNSLDIRPALHGGDTIWSSSEFVYSKKSRTLWTDSDKLSSLDISKYDFISFSNTIIVSASAKTFTRTIGSFITDGFIVGSYIRFSNFTNSSNNTNFVIGSISLDGLTITCPTASGLVTETATSVSMSATLSYPVNIVGNIITIPFSGSQNFSTNGYVSGTFVQLYGFLNPSNNGLFYVSSSTTNTITCFDTSVVKTKDNREQINIQTTSSLVSETSQTASLYIVPTSFVDKYKGTIVFNELLPIPAFDFYSYSTTLSNTCNLRQILNQAVKNGAQIFQAPNDIKPDSTDWYSCVEQITLEGTGDYKDSIKINNIVCSYDLDPTQSMPISLAGYVSLYNKITNPITIVTVAPIYSGSQIIGITPQDLGHQQTLCSGNPLNILADLKNWTSYIFKNERLVFVSYEDIFYVLEKNKHYAYDSVNQKFIINSYAIHNLISPILDADFIASLSFYLVYPTLETNNPTYNIENITRNTNIATRRENNKFNRITFLDGVQLNTYIQTAGYAPELDFDETTGTLLENQQTTRLFKQDLPKLFHRSALLTEDITGTSPKPVNFDPLSPRDTSKWTVYVSPLQQYAGGEQLTSTLWSNFFNAPITGVNPIPYSDVDTSDTAQIENRLSTRWQSVVASIETSHPMYFYASREDTPVRRDYWTRGSASKHPIPYKGNTRASIQGYRRDTALFTRNEFMSDYAVSTTSIYQIDNYKYTNNDLDYTNLYKNFTNDDTPDVTPQTEIVSELFTDTAKFKTKIQNGIIVYPKVSEDAGSSLTYAPQYEDPFNFCHREQYYISGTNLKSSFYANNIRTDANPYTGGLITEAFDDIEIDASGLFSNQDVFTITNTREIEFVLSKQNVFVSWRQVNVGNQIAIGEPLPSAYYVTICPNIRVLKNGIELTYGDFWKFSTEPARVFLTPNCFISPSDVIEIIYDTLDTVEMPTFPSYIDPILGLVECTTLNTQNSTDIHTIPLLGINKNLLLDFPFTHNPIISWYRFDTAEFINTSVDIPRSVSAAKTPIALLYRDLAVPNVKVYHNGILLAYQKDWKFTAIPSSINYSYRIVLRQNISQALTPYDTITIEYVSILNS